MNSEMDFVEVASSPLCSLPHGQRLLTTSALPSPRIKTLLKNNYSPDEFEMSECRRVVKDSATDLATLDREIDMARAHLEHLLLDKETMIDLKKLHQRPILSPRRLDVDILAEIFHAACTTDSSSLSEDEPVHSLDVRLPQWKLGHVCRKWRSVIVERMPTLWTNVTIRISDNDPQRNYLLLDRLLRRSGEHGLHVRLHLHQIHESFPRLQHMLVRLFTSSDRWESFHLEAWSQALGNPSMNWEVLQGNLNQLKKFTACFYGLVSVQGIHDDLITSITTAPGLQILCSSGYNEQDLLLANSANISNSLRMYCWRYCTAPSDGSVKRFRHPNLIQLMERFSYLEECEVDTIFQVDAPAFGHVVMPQLQTLALHGKVLRDDEAAFAERQESETERLLSVLELPSLTKFAITGQIFCMTVIENLISRSRCSLTSLTIPFLDCDSTCRVLSQTPSLQCLTISSENGPDDKFLGRLKAQADSGNTICPGLTRLTLEFTQPMIAEVLILFEWHDLADMLRSRRPIPTGKKEEEENVLPAQIQSLVLRTVSRQGVVDNAGYFSTTLELQSLIHNGLEVGFELYVPDAR